MNSFDNEMAEILESFLIESNEIIESLGTNLLDLERQPGNSELHHSIFRAVHTLKGTSSFLGFEQMTELAHHFEDVLNRIRKGELIVRDETMDVMFEAYDVLKELMRRIEAKNSDPIDLIPILARLDAIAQQKEPPPVGASEKEESDPRVAEHRRPSPGSVAETKSASAESPAAESGASADRPLQGSPKESRIAETTIRVDVARLDTLMNLVGELVLGRNRMAQVAAQINEQHEGASFARELMETSTQIDFITTELQMAVMKTRMIPVAKVFNKLPRLVRDLSKEMEKDIALTIEGEETELDKTIIEELNDPLIHLLRNACDHGIESPSVRLAAGKPAQGRVTVRAEHEGNNIVISIEDDGAGLDAEKLKGKAIERGIITEAEARQMTEAEAFNLIFQPGFSTAARVTNISGRGVGMDVVRTNITRLKGAIEIESTVGKGSTFRLKLPLTLAIIQGLLVDVSGEIFAIPLETVLEVVRVRSADIETVSGREVIVLRNAVLPLVRIAEVFGIGKNGSLRTDRSNGHDRDSIYIVVVGLGAERIGVVVDTMLGQKEVVIKSLGGYLGNVKGIAGSTILGDGRVIMILDVGQFIGLCRQSA